MVAVEGQPIRDELRGGTSSTSKTTLLGVPHGLGSRRNSNMVLGKVARSLTTRVRGLVQAPVLKRTYAAVTEARALLETELESIRAAGTWKAERIITSQQGPQINVDGSRGGELSLVRDTTGVRFQLPVAETQENSVLGVGRTSFCLGPIVGSSVRLHHREHHRAPFLRCPRQPFLGFKVGNSSVKVDADLFDFYLTNFSPKSSSVTRALESTPQMEPDWPVGRARSPLTA